MRSSLRDELMDLPREERLDLIHDLLDSVDDRHFAPLSAEEVADMERDLAAHHADPATSIPWAEAQARLQSRRK